MKLIDSAEYHKRKANLFRCYGGNLPDFISSPIGWIRSLEEMFVMLEMSLKPESLVQIKFTEVVYLSTSAVFYWTCRRNIDDEDGIRATKIIRQYEEISSKQCEVCGMPGKLIVGEGYYSLLCASHADVC